MGDPFYPFYDTNPQQTHDNSSENNCLSLFSSPSCIWNPNHTPRQQNRPITLTSSSENVVSILSLEIGRRSNRNILMTNIPQYHYDFISDMIKTYHQNSIYDIFSKQDLGTVTMAVLFYVIDQAKQCHAQLTHLVEHTMEFHLVDVKFCNSVTVSSIFDIELEKLQNTHLSVSLFGPLSKPDAVNYKEILESFGELHHLAKLAHTQNKMDLLVEYKDTRIAMAAKKALQGKTEQGIVFSAYLTKLEVEQNNARNIHRPIGRSSSTLENRASLLPVSSSSSRHSRASQLAPQYSIFGNSDCHGSLARSSSQIQHSRLLSAPSMAPPTPPPPLLVLPSSNGNEKKRQYVTPVAGPHPFTLQPKDNNVPLMDWSFVSSTLGAHSYRHLQQQPGISMPLPLATAHHYHQRHQKKNMDSNHGLSLVLPTIIGHPMLFPQQTALLTPPTSNSSESESPAIEMDALCYFGPTSPTSPLTIRDDRSSQSIGKVPSNPIRTAEARANYRFDVEKVLNGLDNRTTFMIRNIPNKYTQAMLMNCIDATHRNTYDFLYLRMDFKNKCNVGYAFINFIDVDSVISFARRKEGKHWNQFNSDKKCELSYAKIQGKANLIEKFRNSMVMEQQVSYRPKIFYSSGPRKGEEEEFPSSITTTFNVNS